MGKHTALKMLHSVRNLGVRVSFELQKLKDFIDNPEVKMITNVSDYIKRIITLRYNPDLRSLGRRNPAIFLFSFNKINHDNRTIYKRL